MLLDCFRAGILSPKVPSYESIQGDEKGQKKHMAWHNLPLRLLRRPTYALALILLVVFAIHVGRGSEGLIGQPLDDGEETDTTASFLHMAMATSQSERDFCRTTASCAVTGYPVPQILNHEDQFDDKRFGGAASEWGKFHSSVKFLDSLEPARDNDLIVFVDGQDSWFQLRPEILIRRYQEIVRDADRRAMKQLMIPANETMPSHSVVFAADRECEAGFKSGISCFAAPKSPIKGAKQAKAGRRDANDGETPMSSTPRYLNARFIMGTVKATRELFQTGYDRWHQNSFVYKTQQQLFAELFGIQQYQRELDRIKRVSKNGGFIQWFSSDSSTMLDGETSFVLTHPNPKSLHSDRAPPSDLGITLDYAGGLAQLVAPAEEDDSDWVKLGDSGSISEAAERKKVTSIGAKRLQPDIQASRPPFWSLAPMFHESEGDSALPRNTAWTDLSLYTNLHTGVTPALILQQQPSAHSSAHNAFTKTPDIAAAASISYQWNQMWFRSHLRALLDTIAREPVFPIAHTLIKPAIKSTTPSSPNPAKNKRQRERTWWSPISTSPIDKSREGFGVVAFDDQTWWRWNDLCDEVDQIAVLGDERGAWVDPKVWPPFEGISGLGGADV